METQYEIWLQSAKWFLRCLKSVDDGQTDNLSYKLTNEPSAQASYKKKNIILPLFDIHCDFLWKTKTKKSHGSSVVLKCYNKLYRNDPKFSDRQAWANSADPDQEQSDQCLHYLPFRLHRLDSLLYGRAT